MTKSKAFLLALCAGLLILAACTTTPPETTEVAVEPEADDRFPATSTQSQLRTRWLNRPIQLN